jgi:YbbR domain-containing protein
MFSEAMKRKIDFSILSRRWQLKLLALVIGISLWNFVVGEDQVEVILTIPLELRNMPADLVIANQYRKNIEVAVRGTRRLIQEIRLQNISRPVDLSRAQPGTMLVSNTPETIAIPRGINVQRVQPSSITLQVDRLVQREFPITPVAEGEPAAGYFLKDLVLNPPRITVTGPQTILDRETEFTTSVIDLDGLTHSDPLQVQLDLSEPLLNLMGETVIEVNVVLGEVMVRRTVDNIPVNIRDSHRPVRAEPASVSVEAEIPEPVLQVTPEPAMLFRAAVNDPVDTDTEELPVTVSGVNLPGHAPIVILGITPEKVRIVQ